MEKSKKWRNLMNKYIKRQKEIEKRTIQEFKENLNHQFPTIYNTKKEFSVLIGFLYGGEFKKFLDDCEKGGK